MPLQKRGLVPTEAALRAEHVALASGPGEAECPPLSRSTTAELFAEQAEPEVLEVYFVCHGIVAHTNQFFS